VDLSKLDPGPYPDADAARAMLELDVHDPRYSPAHLRRRGAVVIDLALGHSGVDDLTDYETTTLDEIAHALADPVQAQVIAGWIRRAHQAGHLAAITRSGPVRLAGDHLDD
jgi:hypothetical protein